MSTAAASPFPSLPSAVAQPDKAAPPATSTGIPSYARIARSSAAPSPIEHIAVPPSPAKVQPASMLQSPYSRPTENSSSANKSKGKAKAVVGAGGARSRTSSRNISPVGSNGTTTPDFGRTGSQPGEALAGAAVALSTIAKSQSSIPRSKKPAAPLPASSLSALAPSFSFNPTASSFSPSVPLTDPVVPSPAVSVPVVAPKIDSTPFVQENALPSPPLESLVDELTVEHEEIAIVEESSVVDSVVAQEEEFSQESALEEGEVAVVQETAAVEESVVEPIQHIEEAVPAPVHAQVEPDMPLSAEDVIALPSLDDVLDVDVPVVDEVAAKVESTILEEGVFREVQEEEPTAVEEAAVDSIAADEVAEEVETVVEEPREEAIVTETPVELTESPLVDAVLPSAQEPLSTNDAGFPAEPAPYRPSSPPAPHRSSTPPPPPPPPAEPQTLTAAIYTAWNTTTWRQRIPALLASVLINIGLPFINGVFAGQSIILLRIERC